MSSAQAIDTAAVGSVTWASAAIAAPVRSSPAVTSTLPPAVSDPVVPVPHLMVVEWSSPQAASAATTNKHWVPLMCAQRTHRRPKLHWNRIREKIGAGTRGSVTSGQGMKRLADMHEAPAIRRWALRLGLAVIVAIAIGYVPGQVLRRDPRAVKLEQQLEELRAHAREVAAG